MNCADVAELIPAYALNALDDTERAEVEAHLDSCRLHAEALAFERTAARLAEAAPEREPPTTLRDRIVAAAVQQRAAPPTPIAAAGRPPPMRARPRFVPYALAAAIAVLIVWFVSWNVLSDSDEGAIVRTASSNGINITLVYTPSDAAASISLDGLPAIGSDQTYQLWTIGPGALPVSAGLLERLDDGTAAQSLSGSFEGGTTFAITVEPGGGSEQPTTAPLIATEI